jgi:hypothetical protein
LFAVTIDRKITLQGKEGSCTVTKPVLNIAPVEVPDTTIRVGFFPYDTQTGGDDLARLRRQHPTTHAFTRRDDQIICLPRTQDAPNLGDDQQEIPQRDNLDLVAALLRETLIDHFYAMPRRITAYRPITFLAPNDLLKEALPSGLSPPSWLICLPRYEIDVRRFFLTQQKPFLGVALDSRTHRRVTASCDQLIAAGMDLHGLYVGRPRSREDPRVEPSLELLGRVSAVQGDEIFLEDARDGISSVKTSECYLESNPRNFANIFDQVFGVRADEVAEALFQKTAARRVGPAKLQDLRKAVAYLQKQALEVAPGVKLTVGALIEGAALPPLETAPKPVYVFEPTGAKTSTWSDGGLQNYGPYSRQTFSKNRPRIAVVCQASAKGRVEQFLHKFFNGQPHPKRKPGPFDTGLIGKYRLDGVSPKFFLAGNSSADAYLRAAQDAISEEDRWDLALVQIERSFRDLGPTQNPYLIKACIPHPSNTGPGIHPGDCITLGWTARIRA